MTVTRIPRRNSGNRDLIENVCFLMVDAVDSMKEVFSTCLRFFFFQMPQTIFVLI